jgi:hypothetical protein
MLNTRGRGPTIHNADISGNIFYDSGTRAVVGRQPIFFNQGPQSTNIRLWANTFTQAGGLSWANVQQVSTGVQWLTSGDGPLALLNAAGVFTAAPAFDSGVSGGVVVNAIAVPAAPMLVASLAAPVNSAFTAARRGGTLPAGSQCYRVTAVRTATAYPPLESAASTETCITTTGSTSTVTVNWSAVAGADAYYVYGRKTGAERFLIAVFANTWTDTGYEQASGAVPAARTIGNVTTSYKITCLTGGRETTASTNASLATGAANVGVQVSWTIPTGATSCRVYGRTAGREGLLQTVSAPTNYWLDTGATVAGPVPPKRNATGDSTLAQVTIGSSNFANLSTPDNGALLYCSDCIIANPCAGGGTGALAKRINGAWVCN